jgi:hypothetical protein
LDDFEEAEFGADDLDVRCAGYKCPNLWVLQAGIREYGLNVWIYTPSDME